MMNVHQQSEQLIAFCHEWRVCSTRSALAMPCWLARHQRLHPNSLTTVRVVNVTALGATWLVDCFFSLFQSLLDFFFTVLLLYDQRSSRARSNGHGTGVTLAEYWTVLRGMWRKVPPDILEIGFGLKTFPDFGIRSPLPDWFLLRIDFKGRAIIGQTV